MDVPAQEEPDGKTTITVLVTGANRCAEIYRLWCANKVLTAYSGLGFAICCRLIDEFLFTRPQSQTLHLLYSTRDVWKGEDTSKRLHVHLQKMLREANGKTLGISLLLEGRVKIEGVLVDLTKLLTVKALAVDLLKRGQRLDAVIWNAGFAGWKGVNWPRAVWDCCTSLVHNTTYPDFMIPDVGLLATPQVLDTSTAKQQQRQFHKRTSSRVYDGGPKLGQVFLSNVFGHYMLTHWLSPLFTPQSRIIWISSISALPSTFNIEDIQGLTSHMPYESSKRLTDLIVLTSELPFTTELTSNFFSTPKEGTATAKPKLYLTHPGVMGTSIAGLNWIMGLFMVAGFYLSRLLGSPWHPVSAYKGAISAAFAALAPLDQLADMEERDGKGKWGSAVGVWGDERVARTEVEGWGFCGVPGKVPRGCVTGTAGRHKGHRETTKEMREEFEEEGRVVWQEMERLRVEWERRLGGVDLRGAEDI